MTANIKQALFSLRSLYWRVVPALGYNRDSKTRLDSRSLALEFLSSFRSWVLPYHWTVKINHLANLFKVLQRSYLTCLWWTEAFPCPKGVLPWQDRLPEMSKPIFQQQLFLKSYNVLQIQIWLISVRKPSSFYCYESYFKEDSISYLRLFKSCNLLHIII